MEKKTIPRQNRTVRGLKIEPTKTHPAKTEPCPGYKLWTVFLQAGGSRSCLEPYGL